ncbi:DUF1857-domain-containing protein [Mycena rebaudengoi]|nr:DUF1857-domain-containing protein [Mycena rebaudengoi]
MPSSAFAATRSVNPLGAEPIITETQLWKGLEFKARNPVAFVPMIASSVVTSDNGKNIVRELRLKHAPDVVVTEEIEAHEAAIVYFELSIGTRVTNIISYGPDDELLLTFSFANGIPGVPAEKPSANELNATVGKTVERAIELIRQMVKEGKL